MILFKKSYSFYLIYQFDESKNLKYKSRPKTHGKNGKNFIYNSL